MSNLKSISIVWKPNSQNEGKKLQGSCEVSSLKLAANGGAAHVSLYDAVDSDGANEDSLRWVLDASTTDVDAQSFGAPLVFKKGVFALLDQGAGTNPEVCIAAINYPA